MSKRDMIILGIAVLCGAVGFVFSLNFLKNVSKKPQAVYKCVIALEAIPKSKVLEAKMLTISAPIPVADSADVFFRVEDVAGYSAGVDVAKGAVIQRSQVTKVEAPKAEAPRPQQTPLPIPEGMRGLGFLANQVESFPYGLKVGTYLDIYGTVVAENGKLEKRAVVRGAQVVAVEEAADGSIKNVTVALPPRLVDIVVKSLGEAAVRLVPGAGGKLLYTSFGSAEIIRGIVREKTQQVIQGVSQTSEKKDVKA